ncbi:MAG: hypothetical protein COA84_01130 [Robiginitomaculum sp.]|nr:MAG: hypothetical protein COA84_01130 [Robiginitomaculum sp.]
MSVWFSNKTRAKVLKYEGYPLWLPAVQFPVALLILAAGLGLTPGARGQGFIALIGALWLGRLGWCFYRIIQTRLIKARLRPAP